MGKKDLATVEPAGALAIPMESMGFENFSMDDLIVPRLRLLQGQSQAVSDGKGKIGEFQDSLTGEILGDQIKVVLMGMRNGAVYFENGEGLVCRSSDGIKSNNGEVCQECPYGQYWGKPWKKDEDPPKCSGVKEFTIVTRGTVQGTETRPMLMSFLKTSYKVGKKLISTARLADPRIFACAFKIISVKDKNDKGTFANFTFEKVCKLPDVELAEAYRWFNILRDSNVKVHDEADGVDVDQTPMPSEDVPM